MKKIYYGWWVVGGAFMLLFCAAGTGFYAFPVMFDAIIRDTGWSRTAVSASLAISLFFSGILAPLVGLLINKFGIKWVVIIGSVIAGTGFYLLSTVSYLWQLYFYMGIIATLGIAGMQLVPNFTMIGLWFSKRRSTALGIATAGIGVGGTVIAPLTGILIASYGWHNSFLFLGGMLLVVGVAVGSFIMRTPAEKKLDSSYYEENVADETEAVTEGLTLRQAIKTRPFWLVSMGVMLWGWAYTAVLVHQVAFAVDMGMDSIAAAGAVGTVTLFSIPGRLGFGWLGDRMDKRYIFMMGCALQILALIILLNTHTLTMLYIYSLLLGLNIGGMTPILPGIIGDHFGKKHFGVIFGAAFFWLHLGQVIGSVYAGWIFDTSGSYASSILTSIVLSALAIISVFLVGKPRH